MLNEAKVTVFPMRGFVSLFQDQRHPEKNQRGNRFVETEVTKVFTHHRGWQFDYVFSPQRLR